MRKAHRIGILVALIATYVVAVAILILSYSEVEIFSEFGTGELLSVTDNTLFVSQSVVEDAAGLATELFGDCQEEYNDFVNQLLTVYMVAKEQDFVIVFNSGGWGWDLAEVSPGWSSILDGIKSELENSGYTSLLLEYHRTTESVWGRINELKEMSTRYPSKAQHLAAEVEFLTDNIPDLRVIITGESNGTMICDTAMNILKDNSQVYSIQTGRPPLWRMSTMVDRTLIINDNGIVPDSFSQGDFLTIISANLKKWLGLSRSGDGSGNILFYFEAPGHDYGWQYRGVSAKIIDFLDENFGTR